MAHLTKMLGLCALLKGGANADTSELPAVLPTVTICHKLCPQCDHFKGDNPAKCPCDACWPGSSVNTTSDKSCTCFAKLGMCKPGEKPKYTPGKECPSCWPPENHACDCFAAIGFCEPPPTLPTHSRCGSDDNPGDHAPICPACKSPKCKCPDGACWPGSDLTHTKDHTCDCFAKLGMCKSGEKPKYTKGKECPSCWPPENHACDCFAAIGFCNKSFTLEMPVN